ncbi:response regulator transcription factor [bacterium]|nr:response regulator transcription factor [bacterium]
MESILLKKTGGDFALNSSREILVIEDEADIKRVIELNLAAEGYRVKVAADGLQGLQMIRSIKPDLVLLDLMLPGKDGLDICREVKADKELRHIPIIMVSARGEEQDVIIGLGLGADDYICKPFRVGELMARVRAAFRRVDSAPSGRRNQKLEYGDVTLDLDARKLLVDGDEVHTTATEFRLLRALLENPGKAFSRQLLTDIAIGDEVYVNERTIDSHVSAVRGKLGEARGWIRTVWGVGYRFEPDVD